MTLNSLCCWGSSSRAQDSMESSFIIITPRFTLNLSVSTCSGSIYRFNRCLKNYSYSIGTFKKKLKRKNSIHKDVSKNVLWTQYPTTRQPVNQWQKLNWGFDNHTWHKISNCTKARIIQNYIDTQSLHASRTRQKVNFSVFIILDQLPY